MINRGRFQAQDDNLEESAPWATNDEVSKQKGHERLDNLQNKLTASQLAVRVIAMQKARDLVSNAPINGHCAQLVKTYFDDFRKRVVRVDVEIRAGSAFVTTNN